MKYTVKQMMPAAPGMYLLDERTKSATLVVMWALIEEATEKEPVQHIVGLTHIDLGTDLEDAIDNNLNMESPSYTTQVPKDFKTFR